MRILTFNIYAGRFDLNMSERMSSLHECKKIDDFTFFRSAKSIHCVVIASNEKAAVP